MPDNAATPTGKHTEEFYDLAVWNATFGDWELGDYQFTSEEEGRERLALKRRNLRYPRQDRDTVRLVQVAVTTVITEIV